MNSTSVTARLDATLSPENLTLLQNLRKFAADSEIPVRITITPDNDPNFQGVMLYWNPETYYYFDRTDRDETSMKSFMTGYAIGNRNGERYGRQSTRNSLRELLGLSSNEGNVQFDD